jgi:hypothetical protein
MRTTRALCRQKAGDQTGARCPQPDPPAGARLSQAGDGVPRTRLDSGGLSQDLVRIEFRDAGSWRQAR